MSSAVPHQNVDPETCEGAVTKDDEIEHILRWSRRIAVVGIRPESFRHRAAHHIPAYLVDVGYEIVPVPIGHDDVKSILGFTVCNSLREAGPLDIVSIFLRSSQVAEHVPDIIMSHPKVVWFQSGLIHVSSAQVLIAQGIRVVHDCIGCRRAAISPASTPLEGQMAEAFSHGQLEWPPQR
jgi:predicted CoA-binding protein